MIKSQASELRGSVVDLSVVFLTYNRSKLLVRAMESLQPGLENSGLSYELIVSDDCSAPEHAQIIDSLGSAKIVRTITNAGLGTNSNNGLRECHGRWILQIQDDWEFVGNSYDIARAVEVLERDARVGIVQLTPVHSDLPAVTHELTSGTYAVFANDGLPWRRACGVRPYSDCPHIKRREFVVDIGPYLEDVPMPICESNYQYRVSNQRKWRVAQLMGPPLFVHLGEEHSFNPGGRRHPLVKLLHSIPAVGGAIEPTIRRIYTATDHFCAVVRSRFFSRD
jgi:hypothetical protein